MAKYIPEGSLFKEIVFVIPDCSFSVITIAPVILTNVKSVVLFIDGVIMLI